ncbi:hypothetical protein DEIPH_ctg011orf0037 [Deinococcus phoenicis]|uniref:Uncharacterized protein n=1 Tax=Deinococcus phoenicis TaxID=1476583 RepID=A0A016QSK9_9DEIO|nr:hypothetical protein [Deinococcus phoenicis]EYB69070.1 hypothetical protein DEIPH_ctg011orf0037 [Deinococcus phoenicis]
MKRPTSRITRADRYRACPDESALLREVGRDAEPLKDAYLKAMRDRERGMLADAAD